MGAATNLITEPADRVLVITRVFYAPRTLVFKAWTEREHMERWFGARRGFTSKVLKNDLRPGGATEFICAGPTAIIGRRAHLRLAAGAARHGRKLGGR